MLLIAGIQPKIRKLEEIPRRCTVCGQLQAYRKRVDHYLSFFFIPLVRVKMGEPFDLCDPCANSASMATDDRNTGSAQRQARCLVCGRSLKPDFSFCPHCGTAL